MSFLRKQESIFLNKKTLELPLASPCFGSVSYNKDSVKR
jgi:hypothetical protein